MMDMGELFFILVVFAIIGIIGFVAIDERWPLGQWIGMGTRKTWHVLVFLIGDVHHDHPTIDWIGGHLPNDPTYIVQG